MYWPEPSHPSFAQTPERSAQPVYVASGTVTSGKPDPGDLVAVAVGLRHVARIDRAVRRIVLYGGVMTGGLIVGMPVS